MISIVIADDHDIVRTGVQRILELEDDLNVVGDAGTGRETIELCKQKKPQILILDLDIPDIDGLEVTRILASEMPDVKILILTMHNKEEYAIRVMKAGASGFLLKASSPDELPDVVRKIVSGETFICPSVLKKIAQRQLIPNNEDPVSLLSDRELQIIIKLSEGMLLREIADELHLSTSTVATHKRRLMKKLCLEKNSDIVNFARDRDLSIRKQLN